MIHLHHKDFLSYKIRDLLISSEKVAHVQVKHSLEHALLILVKSGYSAIPVLDPKYQLKGLISTARILDSILGLERIEYERLEHMRVEEVMMTDIPRLHVNDSVVKGLELTIDHPFVCVQNEEGCFEGILTRRALLKKLNQLVLLLTNMR
ncbi:cyclic-di-AMP-binding protein CbpB [Priestia taiwanensis]|uniref:CBS domain-containing protein n=1 Tax=Priestia taiwanensis TaxID=1347902 RepID=A0A917AQM3_9BACI|nr:cyclic-di-AMP-binding protein CbpB [Priestia taiwanensis]MBM7363046.1 putative transcriptional regulator [Priestia taiwanensis]GGE67175.1 CBS domain-containing protein [Priestia taiwanensis]